MKLQDIQKLYKKKLILPVLPSQNEKKGQMYQVVRRLARKFDHKIVPHFFWCSICETVLHINTSRHYPSLTRYYNKCVESQARGLLTFFLYLPEFYFINEYFFIEQILGNSGRKNLQRVIEDMMKIFGRGDISAVKLPEIFSKENWYEYIFFFIC